MTVQYRVAFGKNDEAVEGSDDAALVVTIAATDALPADRFDATVAFMRGKLKSTGSTGELFRVLRNGDAAAAISRLASRP